MTDQLRIQKIAEKLASLNLQPETTKQSRIDSSESKFRQIEQRFDELSEFSNKRTILLKEQIQKLIKTSDEEKVLFSNSLQEKIKSLEILETQFNFVIELEIKVN